MIAAELSLSKLSFRLLGGERKDILRVPALCAIAAVIQIDCANAEGCRSKLLGRCVCIFTTLQRRSLSQTTSPSMQLFAFIRQPRM